MADAMVETTKEQELRYVFHLVIPNKKGDCIVGEVMADGVLRLPRIRLLTSMEFPSPDQEEKIQRCVEAQLGICGYVARSLSNGYNSQIEGVEGVEEHEILLFDILDDHTALQSPLKWIGRDAACNSKWVPTNGDYDVSKVLEGTFVEINGEETNPAGVLTFEAWEYVGWYEEVMSWTRKVLEANDMLMKDRIRDVLRRSDSLVMSCEVQTGRNGDAGCKNSSDVVFIKASVPSVREAQRTATIRKVIGNIVPEVMGIDETGGIMIQRNGGRMTDEPWNQEGVINTILRMQSMSVNRISELEAGGLLVADSEWTETNVERILNHELFERCWKHGGIEEEMKMRKRQVDELRSRVSEIQNVCRRVTRLGLPRTLVHGDLDLSNIGSALKEESNMFRFFDWTDSFIGNPLHDIECFLGGVEAEFGTANYDAGIRQVYELWKPCCTLEELEVVFPLLSIMSDIINLYGLTQEYDACGACETLRKFAIIGRLQEVVERLTFESSRGSMSSDSDDAEG